MQKNTNHGDEEPQDLPAKKPLYPVYFNARGLLGQNPSVSYKLLDEAYRDIDSFTSGPDIWHNTGIIASRVLHLDAELGFVTAGLREWPNDVDLLCDALQLYRTTSYNPDLAADTWKQLQAMDRGVTGPYWRFWVFGAVYLAQDLHDREEGVNLLDQGLRAVKRDGLMDVLRSYRNVLIDTPPSRPYANEEETKERFKDSIALIESRYRLGIDLGIENGYVLALDLAKLSQERAGSQQMMAGKPRDFLREALDYLDLAENMYTGDPNHGIGEIYLRRASIYMAQHRFGDALRLLQSARPQRDFDIDSYTVLRKYAAVSSGGQDTEDSGQPEASKVDPDAITQQAAQQAAQMATQMVMQRLTQMRTQSDEDE